MPESRPGRVRGGVGPAPVAAPHLRHPVLDIACAAHCASGIAHALDRPGEAGQAARFLDLWRAAFNPATGVMRPGRYYEAAHTHYSFRLSGAVRAEAGPVLRLRRSAGAAATRAAVGRGAPPRHGPRPIRRGEQRGDAGDPVCLSLRRRPGRSAEIVRAVMRHHFADSPGGLPGNDGSGALSVPAARRWTATGSVPHSLMPARQEDLD